MCNPVCAQGPWKFVEGSAGSGEALGTIMTEVESVLNSRPLTPNSDNPADFEALTPNHLLLLQPEGSMPPGVFSVLQAPLETNSVLSGCTLEKMALKLSTSPSRTPKMDKTVTEFLCWRLGFGC